MARFGKWSGELGSVDEARSPTIDLRTQQKLNT
jgi:hypothetical protein